MRILPISIALVLALAAPALAASSSAKMTGQDQNATGPSHKRSTSSKMHGSQPGGAMNKHQPTSSGGSQ